MNLSLGILVSPAKVIALTAATAAIAMIFLTPNFTITDAQQLPQTGQQSSSMPQSPTLLNSKDSFRVKLPEGWVIQDINNTGFTLAAEVLQGYGLLAQLCPQQEQQREQQAALSNVSGSSSTTTTSNRYIGSCQDAGEEVIHIIRYPNLGARLGITSDEDVFTIIENWGTVPNAILAYHLQKLQEVGYSDFKIVNSIDTTINVDNSTDLSNGRRMATTTTTTIPAELVEMTYSTNLAPNETKTGYFLLTATAATPRNLGVLTGYSIFYEGNSTVTAEGATISTGSTLASPPSISTMSFPSPIRQVFDSFELVAAPTAEPLTVEITSDDTEGIAPATFEFEAEISGGIEPYTISWDFGDGSSGSGSEEEEEEEGENSETIEHTYDISGVYNARVSVTDSTGRTAAGTILIIVDEPPPLTAVDIISNGTEGIAPATFEFEANVTGGIEPYTYRWSFGDGSRATDDDEDIVHTFGIAGMYNVSLIVIDSTGRAATDSMLIIIDEQLPPPPLRLIEIIPSDTEGIAPATFEFEANVTGGIEPYTYRWSFGDGSRESGNDGIIEHTFEEAGTYNVSLIVIDSAGRTAYGSVLIIVESPSPPPLTAVDIISNGTEGIAPATFEFEANVTGGIEPYTYRWSFGDGSDGESNTQTVLRTFDIAGTYNVSLIATDSQNQVAFDSMAITIEEPEQPAVEEEQPSPEGIDNGLVSNGSFGLADLMERLEWRNNNNVVTFGVTSAADDYDATAEHWWHLGLRNTAAFASSSDLSWLAMLDRAGMAVYGI